MLLECSMTGDGPSSVRDQGEGCYADVIVPRHISKSFTYFVPPHLVKVLDIGHWVLVPFGRAVLQGVVISLSPHPPAGMARAALKAIRSPALDAEAGKLPFILFELSRKIAEHYVAPWGQCLRLVSPTMTRATTNQSRYVVTDQGRQALQMGHCPDTLRPTLSRIARRSTGLLSATLQSAQLGKSTLILKTLLDKSWIATSPNQRTGGIARKQDDKPSLYTSAQEAAVDYSPFPIEELTRDHSWNRLIADCLDSSQPKKIVLHARWSHRLSRLVAAIRQAYDRNKSVVVITGEVAKAVWLRHLLEAITKLPVTLLHPALSTPHEPARDGEPEIIIGTRSAIFTPRHPVGLIWVDGEEDPALKEQQEPRYHAREVAWLRAELERATLVLGTSHPTLESKFDTDADIHAIPEEEGHRPKTDLIDLRGEPRGSLLTPRLVQAIRHGLNDRAGIVLFLNRKGYANTLVCQECSWIPRCASCDVPLAYYRDKARVVCRYCPITEALPDCCPHCHSSRLNPLGEGTEGVETEVRRLFPHAKITRLDSTTLRTRAASHLVWEEIRSGKWDIVIGTQALFQRDPLPPQGLVAILYADSGLHISDFRAAERTYHLMVDAASLARPAAVGGQLIIQTRLPQHHAVEAVLTNNPKHFYDEELAARRLLNYPPACCLADLWIFGKDLPTVEQASQRWVTHLETPVTGQESVRVLGPISVNKGRPQDRYQHRVLVKGMSHRGLRQRIRESVQTLEQEYRTAQVKFVVDIDPVELG